MIKKICKCGKDFLFEEYINNKKSSYQIAKELNCSKGYILTRLRKYDIKIRKQNKMVVCKCSMCNKNFYIQPYKLKLNKEHFCSKRCFKLHRSIYNIAKNELIKQKISLAQRRIGRHSHQDGRIFKTYKCKECDRIIHFKTALYGDGYCKYCANKGERNHNYGRTIIIKFCKYKNIWFKSSWEANFAKWCDLSGIKWKYELKSFSMKINRKNTNYTPDFYLPEFDCYIEIKGYWRKDAKEKFIEFSKYNLNIELFEKNRLKELGVI